MAEHRIHEDFLAPYQTDSGVACLCILAGVGITVATLFINGGTLMLAFGLLVVALGSFWVSSISAWYGRATRILKAFKPTQSRCSVSQSPQGQTMLIDEGTNQSAVLTRCVNLNYIRDKGTQEVEIFRDPDDPTMIVIRYEGALVLASVEQSVSALASEQSK